MILLGDAVSLGHQLRMYGLVLGVHNAALAAVLAAVRGPLSVNL